ncbi:response regulator transcription factor, partial [Nostoc sp. FACHB-152]|uniref:response regulator transcription factor n=1 Tax=Nostoc sp. FACHB-152 TaxID=2692837 RepID=UPI001683C505
LNLQYTFSPCSTPFLTSLSIRGYYPAKFPWWTTSNREIAQVLFLSEGTVRNHISHILTRLNLRDRTQAAIVANTYLSFLENQ